MVSMIKKNLCLTIMFIDKKNNGIKGWNFFSKQFFVLLDNKYQKTRLTIKNYFLLYNLNCFLIQKICLIIKYHFLFLCSNFF